MPSVTRLQGSILSDIIAEAVDKRHARLNLTAEEIDQEYKEAERIPFLTPRTKSPAKGQPTMDDGSDDSTDPCRSRLTFAYGVESTPVDLRSRDMVAPSTTPAPHSLGREGSDKSEKTKKSGKKNSKKSSKDTVQPPASSHSSARPESTSGPGPEDGDGGDSSSDSNDEAPSPGNGDDPSDSDGSDVENDSSASDNDDEEPTTQTGLEQQRLIELLVKSQLDLQRLITSQHHPDHALTGDRSDHRFKIGDKPPILNGRPDANLREWILVMENRYSKAIQNRKGEEDLMSNITRFFDHGTATYAYVLDYMNRIPLSQRTWESFKKELLRYFKTFQSDVQRFERLALRKPLQANEQLHEYISRMERLRLQLPENLLEAVMVYFFTKGLPDRYAKYIMGQGPKTYREIIISAQELQNSSWYEHSVMKSNPSSSSSSGRKPAAAASSSSKTTKRHRMIEYSPTRGDDRKRNRNERRSRCWRCGANSHLSSDCFAGDDKVEAWSKEAKARGIKLKVDPFKLPKSDKKVTFNYPVFSYNNPHGHLYHLNNLEQWTKSSQYSYIDVQARGIRPKFGRSLGTVPVSVFVDSGASFDAVSVEYADRIGMKVRTLEHPIKMTIGCGKQVDVERRIGEIRIDIDGIGEYRATCFVLEHIPEGRDVMLGMKFLESVNPDIDWTTGQISKRLSHGEIMAYHSRNPLITPSGETKVINGLQLIKSLKPSRHNRDGTEFFTLRVVSSEASEKSRAERGLDKQSVKEDPWTRLKSNPAYRVLMKYRDTVFSDHIDVKDFKDRPTQLEHTIEVTDTTPIVRRNYRMSPEQKEAVAKWVDEMVSHGLIVPSTSPYCSPILVLKKPNGKGYRITHDYRLLNRITRIPQYPMPRREDIIDSMSGGYWFSCADLSNGFYNQPIRNKDRHLTAFSTNNASYEYCVTAQGLAGAPATFNRFIQSMFGSMKDFVHFYFDDCYIFTKSSSVEDHVEAIDRVFKRLEEEKLKVNLSKCLFVCEEIPVLGDFVGRNGVRIDPSKVEIIENWPIPKTRQQLKSFLGTVVYNSKYCRDFGELTAPLHEATVGKSKNESITLSPEQLVCFERLKESLANAPVLGIPDSTLQFGIRTDASNFAVGGSLFNILPDGTERTLAYYGKKMSSEQLNYSVREKEMLSILQALRIWRPYLLDKPFVCETDHKSLDTLLRQSTCTQRIARWLNELAEYPIFLKWIPGHTNDVADMLSRHPSFESANASASIVPMREFLKDLLKDESVFAHEQRQEESLEQLVRRHLAEDKYLSDIVNDLSKEGKVRRVGKSSSLNGSDVASDDETEHRGSKDLRSRTLSGSNVPGNVSSEYDRTHRHFRMENGLLWFIGSGTPRLCLPNVDAVTNRVLYEIHDSATAGHPGYEKTLVECQSKYFWRYMVKKIRHYVRTCNNCQRVKSGKLGPVGLLNPLEIPDSRWRDIGMDHLTGIPTNDNGNDAIWVITDRMTKRIHLIESKKKDSAGDLAKRFVNQYVRLHGLPSTIVSDRGSLFVSKFWNEVMVLLDTKHILSSSHHQQTDGQTERVNQFIIDYLRAFIDPTHTHWNEHLALLEFAYNRRHHSAIGMSPFECDLGYNPRTVDDLKLEASLKRKRSKSNDFVNGLKSILTRAKDSMAIAQEKMESSFNKRRREVKFEVDDEVMLSTRNLALTHLGLDSEARRKLGPKWIGPFKVVELTTPDTYRISLPDGLRLHPEFHVTMLKPYNRDSNEERTSKATDFVVYKGQVLHIVDRIVDSRKRTDGTIELRVRWFGEGPEGDTWEPRDQLLKSSARGFVTEYERVHQPESGSSLGSLPNISDGLQRRSKRRRGIQGTRK